MKCQLIKKKNYLEKKERIYLFCEYEAMFRNLNFLDVI